VARRSAVILVDLLASVFDGSQLHRGIGRPREIGTKAPGTISATSAPSDPTPIPRAGRAVDPIPPQRRSARTSLNQEWSRGERTRIVDFNVGDWIGTAPNLSE